ncbi:MAG: AAA domain-containing protein [Breznakia sp.]
MNNESKKITKYLRNAVAAQANMGIDFKVDAFFKVTRDAVTQGKIDLSICSEDFAKGINNACNNGTKAKDFVDVIICAKTIKTLFEENEKIKNDLDELTGIYYIPAKLDAQGFLYFDDVDKKLPWFPREYLVPMVESQLAIGSISIVDGFMSDRVDLVEKISSWADYVTFFKDLYETVTKTSFKENTIKNLDILESLFALEESMYIFLDKTVYATFHIIDLYNHLQQDETPKALYDNFISIKEKNPSELIKNNSATMGKHCAQMNGTYALSLSQREAINHFNSMEDGEILAVNGPPGTGKTTLLQTIVANMYVERAIKREKAPLIVASSTNNQAVTNIIASFGNIKKLDISNLEERWIVGVNSFASYFPSSTKIQEAKNRGYQYTNQKGEFFVSEIEEQDNIVKSKSKLIESCNTYFGEKYDNITACQKKLHDELLYIEKSRISLLSLAQEISQYDLGGECIDQFLEKLGFKIEEKQMTIENIHQRIIHWRNGYKKIPFHVRWLKFIKSFEKKIQTEFRLLINDKEQDFLNEYMSFEQIKEKYSQLYADYNTEISSLKNKKYAIEKIKNKYDNEIELLKQHHIHFHEEKEQKYKLDLDYVNTLLDKKHRYVEFWLAVHYYECRWVDGEDALSQKQKGKNFENVLKQFYNRLSMITPCLVMTFYMLPKQFKAFDGSKNFFLYNYIDLLIVDEAGQVSPEIAAGAFSLAKKAVVVGDIYQIEPVWSLNEALDKTLALSSGAISRLEDFSLLKNTGLNSSCSSVMKVAAKCCKYEKFDDKGLFLSEHRRCYNEIIEYCNQLVYRGNLQPMRGSGKKDTQIAIEQWPQMGFRRIDTKKSNRSGKSRNNLLEAEQIAKWLKENFDLIKEAYPNEEIETLVGVITPFKAQVTRIKHELKKYMSTDYSKISVGTVHTFQGAERKIIILSTVYGEKDGCFFIDANKSLMNVAVSRAKDHFFVFGDIRCLKDGEKSASGLLKQYIAEYEIKGKAL